ncbi:MAG TPA: hypothetical protein VIL95_05945 [Bacillota bacterium]
MACMVQIWSKPGRYVDGRIVDTEPYKVVVVRGGYAYVVAECDTREEADAYNLLGIDFAYWWHDRGRDRACAVVGWTREGKVRIVTLDGVEPAVEQCEIRVRRRHRVAAWRR